MRVRCPECGKKYVIPERHVGKAFDCRRCQTRIRTREVRRDQQMKRRSQPVFQSSLPVLPDEPTLRESFKTTPEMSPLAQSGWFKVLMAVPMVAGLLLIGYVFYLLIGDLQIASQVKSAGDEAMIAANAGDSSALDTDSDRPTRGARQEAGPVERVPFRDVEERHDAEPLATTSAPNAQPTLPFKSTFDPTILQFDPVNSKRILAASIESNRNCEPLLFALNYGSREFRDLYFKGMQAGNRGLRFDCAAASAAWGGDAVPAIMTLLKCYVAEVADASRDSFLIDDRISTVNQILAAHSDSTWVALQSLADNGNVDEQDFAKAHLVSRDAEGQSVFGLPLLGRKPPPTSLAAWLKNRSQFEDRIASVEQPLSPAARLVPFGSRNAMFEIGLPDFPPDSYEMTYQVELNEELDNPRWPHTGHQLRSGPWDSSIDERDALPSLKVYGLTQTVRNGELITVRAYRTNGYSDQDYWTQSSEALAGKLSLDRIVKSNHDFDRIRFFYVGETPKAQRYVRVGDIVFDIRWVGRNHRAHAHYLSLFFESFRANKLML